MPRVAASIRRGELVDATIKVALAEGLEAATVRRIAQEAGVSLGTVHYCFGSKRALLEAVVETISQPTLEVDTSGYAVGDVAGLIHAAFRAYWDEAGGNRDRQRLIYELVNHLVREEDPGPELARKIFQRSYETVERFLQEHVTEISDIGLDPHIVARMVVAVTDGVAIAWIADGDDAAALTVLDHFAVVFASLVPSTTPVTA